MKKDKNWLKEQLSYLQDGVGESFNDFSTGLNAAYNTLELLINQLEEPNEIELSEPSAWKTIAKLYHPNEVYWGNVRDSYLESLDEPDQEKVVVPQFVADFIEEIKPNFNIRAVFTLENDKHEQGQEWALDNPDVFARAWLDGFLIEQEKRYYVYDKATKSYLGYNAVRTQLNWWTSKLENESFTEQEIKNIDERYWAFAEEITK